MNGGMDDFGFFAVLVVVLLIVLVVLGVTATVWLLRDLTARRRPELGRSPGGTSDP